MTERRHNTRFPLQLEVEWSPAGRPCQGGRTADISATGLYVEGDAEPLSAGSPVQLRVRLPLEEGGCPVDLRGSGRVVRVKRTGGDQVGVAVAFDRIEFLADDLESLT